ncbi:serine hydrolase domain-containing protein [Leucobacter sp. HY1908]
MRRFVLAAGLTAALFTLAGCAGGSSETPTPSAQHTSPENSQEAPKTADATLSAAFEEGLVTAGIPGGTLYVTTPSGDITDSWGTAGVSPDARVTAGTVFAYRSITKSFIGTVILQLQDEGALSLSDPIAKYVPGVPGGDEITLDDLGRMRSGLANYTTLPALQEALATRAADPVPTDTLLEWAYAASPDFAPGARYEYSNTNTLLLGQVIEAVTGGSWFDAVNTRILDPLKLSSVADGFLTSAHDATGFNVTADADPEPLPTVAPEWFGAAGALTGTAQDLAAWGAALGDDELVSEASGRARVESLAPTGEDSASPAYDRYGFALGEISGWLGHTGTGLGFQSLVMHDAATDRTVAILVNGTGDDPDAPAHIFKGLLPLLDEQK